MKENLSTPPLTKRFSLYSSQIVFCAILLMFLITTFVLGTNLKPVIVPDERVHYIFIWEFAKTWSIPQDSEVTYYSGTYITDHPYLFYWIGGRLDNLFELISPNHEMIDRIIFQRHVNSIYACFTVLFCYLLSRKLIHNSWWQLLPPFMLINTLMFVTISSGVNYDNLLNALVSGSLYFFVRSLDSENYLVDSLIWMALGGMAVLTKVTALPVIGVLGLFWIYLTIKRKTKLTINPSRGLKNLWIVPLIIIIILSASFYISNLLKYQSIVPECQDFLDVSICNKNPQLRRDERLSAGINLNPRSAVANGYLDPIQYAFYSWPRLMALRTYGIMGHKSYYPYTTGYFPILFLWLILIGVRTIRTFNLSHISILVSCITLTLIHLALNYRAELLFGFAHVGVQGRYLFPVIGGFYVLTTLGLSEARSRFIKYGTLILTLILFIYCGPLKFVIGSQSFAGWFR
jgi:hypothetical protein